MAAKNRFSVSFSDENMQLLEHIATAAQSSKSEVVRKIVAEFLKLHPSRFRLETEGFDEQEVQLRVARTRLSKTSSEACGKSISKLGDN